MMAARTTELKNHPPELTELVNEIATALEPPPDWRLASDRWLDLSVSCKNTSLEQAVDLLADWIRLHDVHQTRALLQQIRRQLA